MQDAHPSAASVCKRQDGQLDEAAHEVVRGVVLDPPQCLRNLNVWDILHNAVVTTYGIVDFTFKTVVCCWMNLVSAPPLAAPRCSTLNPEGQHLHDKARVKN